MTLITPKKEDAIHKAWLLRLLTEIVDHPRLAASLLLKGGTCAAMRGTIDRFSVDLDFDAAKEADPEQIRQDLEMIFHTLQLKIDDTSEKVPQYFVKYPRENGRNTIKIDVLIPAPVSNKYETIFLPEIDRMVTCQTIPTMFANKLVAVLDRYEKHEGIAGRDIYDIHEYFMEGKTFEPAVIEERQGVSVPQFLKQLISFLEKKISQQHLDEDLNVLLPKEIFSQVRKTLKQETIVMLKDELKRWK